MVRQLQELRTGPANGVVIPCYQGLIKSEIVTLDNLHKNLINGNLVEYIEHELNEKVKSSQLKKWYYYNYVKKEGILYLLRKHNKSMYFNNNNKTMFDDDDFNSTDSSE